MLPSSSSVASTPATPAVAVDGATSVRPPRLASIDAYRGFVMLLMMGEVLRFARVAQLQPESGVWRTLGWLQSHVEWTGCSLHDLIQPGFSFLVGVALPFSLASRAAAGAAPWRLYGHALWRASVLILLGVLLRSLDRPMLNWTFEDTLTQIGLGYFFLFALGARPLRDVGIALGGLLVAVWIAFVAWPLPAADFDYARVGVSPAWRAEHGLTGLAAHWQKNSNLAWAFDTWFLNLFPREKPFLFNRGGYATLSFVPTLATMLLGLIAGRVLRDTGRTERAKLRWFALAGTLALAGGLALHALGVCPVVKRVWTPSWVLVSGGASFWLLAAFHGTIEVAGWRRWAGPLVVVGANSIAAYLIAHLCHSFLQKALGTIFGAAFFRALGPAYEPLLLGAGVLLVMWLMLYWLWRRKIFLKI